MLESLFYDFPRQLENLECVPGQNVVPLNSTGNKCWNCLIVLQNEEASYKHSKQCKRFACRECAVTRSDYESLKTHVWRIHHFHIHRCQDCGYISFYDTDEVLHRSMSCPFRGQYECESCGIIFAAFLNVENHMLLAHTPDQGYRCNYCSYETDTKAKVRLHQKRHTADIKMHRCPYCAWGSEEDADVAAHIKKYHIGT